MRRQQLVLDRPGDRDLALEALLAGRVLQEALDGVRHAVEGPGEVADLVARLGLDPHGKIAAGRRLGGARQAIDVAGDRADEDERDRERDGVDEEDDPADHEESDAEGAADLVHALREELADDGLRRGDRREDRDVPAFLGLLRDGIEGRLEVEGVDPMAAPRALARSRHAPRLRRDRLVAVGQLALADAHAGRLRLLVDRDVRALLARGPRLDARLVARAIGELLQPRRALAVQVQQPDGARLLRRDGEPDVVAVDEKARAARADRPRAPALRPEATRGRKKSPSRRGRPRRREGARPSAAADSPTAVTSRRSRLAMNWFATT